MAANDSLIDGPSYDRLFKAPPEIKPLDLPGQRGREQFREIAEQNVPGAMAGPPLLSREQEAIVNAIVDRIAKQARNTNFTASLPAYTTPMYWSNNIDESDTISLGAAVSPFQTVLSYKAPPSRYGLVNAYGYDVQDPAFTYDGSILWRMMLNGQPVQSLVSFGEHRGSMVLPASTFIIVPMDQELQFQVRRATAAGGDQSIAMKFKGWDWLLRKNDEGTKAGITAF